MSDKSTIFHVVFEGIKLPADVERRIEENIRKLVLSELASLDLKGDLQIVSRSKLAEVFKNAHNGPIGAAIRLIRE